MKGKPGKPGKPPRNLSFLVGQGNVSKGSENIINPIKTYENRKRASSEPKLSSRAAKGTERCWKESKIYQKHIKLNEKQAWQAWKAF